MLGLHASAEENTVPSLDGELRPPQATWHSKRKKLVKVNSSSTGNKGTNIIKCQSVVDRLLCISINSSHFMVEETGLGEKMAES